jgi:LPXTG-motif cell wall-anchored protein
MSALLSLLLSVGLNAFAQEDSVQIAEEQMDTISIDSEAPKYYEEEAVPEKSSNITTYVIIGGVIVIGVIAFALSRKKKKE